MPYRNRRCAPLPLTRVLLKALIVSLLPVSTALAQPPSSVPRVRVTRDDAKVLSNYAAIQRVMTQEPAGTELIVIHTEGDWYRRLDSNWYWVLLPRDPWGTQRAGWISGRDVEFLPPEPAPAPTPAAVVDAAPEIDQAAAQDALRAQQQAMEAEAARARQLAEEQRRAAMAATSSAAPAAPIPDVVVHFAFNKSDLLDTAKAELATAVASLKDRSGTLSFALEGHADSTGPEPYNERLGMARAESVKRYLAEQQQVPADRISVVSYGEQQPAASNDTREGRAQNRRVVVKINPAR